MLGYQMVGFILRGWPLNSLATTLLAWEATQQPWTRQILWDQRPQKVPEWWPNRRAIQSHMPRVTPTCAHKPTSWKMLHWQKTQEEWIDTRMHIRITYLSLSAWYRSFRRTRWPWMRRRAAGQPSLTSAWRFNRATLKFKLKKGSSDYRSVLLTINAACLHA